MSKYTLQYADRNNQIYDIGPYAQVKLLTGPLNQLIKRRELIWTHVTDFDSHGSYQWNNCFQLKQRPSRTIYGIQTNSRYSHSHTKNYLTDLGKTLPPAHHVDMKVLKEIAHNHYLRLSNRKNIVNLTTKSYEGERLTDVLITKQNELIVPYIAYYPTKLETLDNFYKFLDEVFSLYLSGDI